MAKTARAKKAKPAKNAQKHGKVKKVKKPVEDRKSTWRQNHVIILRAYMELLKLFPEINPEASEIAEKCGLHYNTVRKHIDEYDPQKDIAGSSIRMYTQKIIKTLTALAVSGDVKAAKLWREWVARDATPLVLGGAIKVDNGPDLSGYSNESLSKLRIIHEKEEKRKGGTDGK